MWAKSGKKVGEIVGETMFFELIRLCSDCVWE